MEEQRPKNKTTPWILVLCIIVVFPFMTAYTMNSWLGVPEESNQTEETFSYLGFESVPVLEHRSLLYNRLYFSRLHLQPDGLQGFYRQLSDHEPSGGKADSPISFKIEREWWDPELDVDGTTWSWGEVTLWSPDGHPELVYIVVRVP